MKKAIATTFGLAVIAVGSHALAGWKWPQNVQVTNTIFSGTPGDVRASADDVQTIQCYTIGYGTRAPYGVCAAKDITGKSKMCTFDAKVIPGFAQALATMSDISNITVWFNTDGTCSQIQVQNASFNRPSSP
jgi:hypothetical protein